MRRAAKKDRNHRGIVKSLRGIPGVTVFDTGGVGDGFPDIVVGRKGVNYLFEIKDGDKPPSQKQLTQDEAIFHSTWQGQVNVVETFTEVFKIIFEKK